MRILCFYKTKYNPYICVCVLAGREGADGDDEGERHPDVCQEPEPPETAGMS